MDVTRKTPLRRGFLRFTSTSVGRDPAFFVIGSGNRHSVDARAGKAF
jgi:hypothetical protein